MKDTAADADANSGGSTESSPAAVGQDDSGIISSDENDPIDQNNNEKQVWPTPKKDDDAAEPSDVGPTIADRTPATLVASVPTDDTGSSRLFQPHRTLGLLTPDASRSPSSRLFRSQHGKFHLEPQAHSSEETFVTVPLGERFQIITLSKLVPVLVSRALPPSAEHHRPTVVAAGNGTGCSGAGGGEEEMHRAVSDSSLSITVTTHGPKSIGRAVSITLYSRTRPLVCLDAFPFLAAGRLSRKKEASSWGIVDVIPLGKQRVAMSGEKEGKKENALLFAMVCAKGDIDASTSSEDGEGGDGVPVVGDDSEEEESESSSDESESTTRSSSTIRDDTDSSSSSLASSDDEETPPPKDCYGRVLLVRASRTNMEILNTIDLTGIGSYFVPYVGLHPATYVNKILLGGCPARVSMEQMNGNESSSLLLLNVRSGKMIHSFQCLSSKDCGIKQQGQANRISNTIITTLAQSPAVDAIAVGTSTGSVNLINTLHDVKLFSFQHRSKQHSKKTIINNHMDAVSSLSFRTDGNATRQGVAPLAVGGEDGSLSVWDLTPVEQDGSTARRTLLTRVEGAHHGGISKLEFLPGEPLLLSTGRASNSLVLRVFDAPDHSGRVLRQRKGHTSPPRLLRYLHQGISGGGILANASDGTDAASCQILSCGGPGDLSLRLFSTARSNLDKEYSQGPGLERKAKKFGKNGPEGRAELLLPEIVGLATSEARSRDWGDVVTIHRDHAMAYVWSSLRYNYVDVTIFSFRFTLNVFLLLFSFLFDYFSYDLCAEGPSRALCCGSLSGTLVL